MDCENSASVMTPFRPGIKIQSDPASKPEPGSEGDQIINQMLDSRFLRENADHLSEAVINRHKCHTDSRNGEVNLTWLTKKNIESLLGQALPVNYFVTTGQLSGISYSQPKCGT